VAKEEIQRLHKAHDYFSKKEDAMKKLVILMIAMMCMVFASAVMADEMGGAKAGRLFLFQKCDAALIGTQDHDSFGCPIIGKGPWPIIPDSPRWGILNYSLWGDEFEFCFSGRGLLPDTNYTLIYYPDPWPGNLGDGLICLGSGKTTPEWSKWHRKWRHKGGDINIYGHVDINTSLPAEYDANSKPMDPSGAVGAKIWLVLSDDVQCSNGPQMLNWKPTEYLFEYNLIVFEHRPNVPDDEPK
jgi:hypothetical protein